MVDAETVGIPDDEPVAVRTRGEDGRLTRTLRYGRLALSGIAGRLPGPFGRPAASAPELAARQWERQVRAEPEHLAAYARVCGFDLTDTLPPTFPHVLAFDDTLRLLADPQFPFPAIGLVHVGNRIEQHREIERTEALAVRTRLGSVIEHHRGQQFDVLVDASIGNTVVWRSASRYLHVQRSGRESGRTRAPRLTSTPVPPTARWWVDRDIGRRYAAVSHDPNPIHQPVPALLLGRRRPIAHGMWLVARCLAALTGRLPSAYAVDVDFRRPVRLPTRLGFAAWGVSDREFTAGWDFQLRDLSATSPGVRLTGGVRPLPGPVGVR